MFNNSFFRLCKRKRFASHFNGPLPRYTCNDDLSWIADSAQLKRKVLDPTDANSSCNVQFTRLILYKMIHFRQSSFCIFGDDAWRCNVIWFLSMIMQNFDQFWCERGVAATHNSVWILHLIIKTNISSNYANDMSVRHGLCVLWKICIHRQVSSMHRSISFEMCNAL